jgi:hypothetical protein
MIDTDAIRKDAKNCVSQARPLDGFPGASTVVRLGNYCAKLCDHIDSLQDEIQMMNSYLNANAEIIAMNQRTIDAQAEEIKRLREALQFYADCEHYERMADGQLFVIETGDIARAALKPEEAPCQK